MKRSFSMTLGVSLTALLAFGVFWFASQNRVYHEQSSVIPELNALQEPPVVTSHIPAPGDESETVATSSLSLQSPELQSRLQAYSANREAADRDIQRMQARVKLIKPTDQELPFDQAVPNETLSRLNERIEALRQYILEK